MNVQIIQVPYDSGHENIRTGKGPDYFVENGLEEILHKDGHDVTVYRVTSSQTLSTEIGTTFDNIRRLAESVKAAIDNRRFPLVLAGNCNSCIGSIAGIASEKLGISWFDAHGDFNTPDTTLTGFLDGMGLAMANGRGWRSLLNSIPGFQPIPANRIVHVGARDLDAAEKKLLVSANISLLTPFDKSETEILEELSEMLWQLKKRVDGVYVHIDMDVLDTDQGQPNHLAVPGGLSLPTVEDAIRLIKTDIPIKGSAIASYDPQFDRNNSVLNAGFSIIQAILRD